MNLLVATRNAHKLDEIRAILELPGLVLLDIDACGRPLPEVEEDAGTLAGNAIKKARVLSEASGLWTLADDSGLEVDALGGAPGVYSARYAGANADDAANNRKLLRNLAAATDRRARFRCVLALVAPDGRCWTEEGVCEGTIARTPSGAHGFGYDPLFVPQGAACSFAALPAAEKNRISHRARALAAAVRAWSGLLREG
jgi:XTP/dITP diphosphohydrolase